MKKKPIILAIMNYKGGVGKTTIARLASEYLARDGSRVLGIDTDPQCNYSDRYLSMERNLEGELLPPQHPNFNPENEIWASFPSAPPGYWSIAQLYALGYVEPYPTKIENLSIIPGHTAEMASLMGNIRHFKLEDPILEILKSVLSDGYFSSNFDVIIIDTGAHSSIINNSVLHAATHLIIPTQLHPNSIEGMVHMSRQWRLEQAKRTPGNPLTIAGILPTHYNPRATQQHHHLKSLIETKETQRYIMPPMQSMITYQTASATLDGKSLFNMHPSSACLKNAIQVLESIRTSLAL